MGQKKVFDVVILGGGLAGMCLALQLQNAHRGISILILEKRKGSAQQTIHKIGESSSELGAYYLNDVLGLSKYLHHNHLTKVGTRFYYKRSTDADISERVEISPEIETLYPTLHIDRGVFENDLEKILIERDILFLQDCRVVNVSFSSPKSIVDYESDNKTEKALGKWIIDSTGRSSFLKRKLDLAQSTNHTINSAWLHLDTEVDIDNWSNNEDWQDRPSRNFRKLSTNHLMGKGYWVWIIPLKTKRTSIGIVADPRVHDFQNFNTLPKALAWLKKYEKDVYSEITKNPDSTLDFKVMKDFAFQSKHYFSAKRWALTGDAAAFIDPLYSPGLDFIGLTNSWITDLVIRDLNGENISFRAITYEHTFKELFKGWIKLYENQYPVFGTTQIMLFKNMWDWATYWSIPCVMFVNNGYVNLEVIKAYSNIEHNIGKRFSLINEKVQQLFIDWNDEQFEDIPYQYCNLFALDFLHSLQVNVTKKYDTSQLTKAIENNLTRLEQIAAEMFWYALQHKYGKIANFQVNPYKLSITDSLETIIKTSTESTPIVPSIDIKNDVAKMWFSNFRRE